MQAPVQQAISNPNSQCFVNAPYADALQQLRFKKQDIKITQIEH